MVHFSLDLLILPMCSKHETTVAEADIIKLTCHSEFYIHSHRVYREDKGWTIQIASATNSFYGDLYKSVEAGRNCCLVLSIL